MRVISGEFRGKVLSSPTSDNIRPTGDKVKQAIFTKLQFFVPNKVVLDLFSGSGALGIEAISRGASKVIFVDKDKRSVNLTKQNLAKIGSNAKVINADFSVALKSFDYKFDLILIDPPYKSGVYEKCLQQIFELNLLNGNGIIVCERDKTLPISCPYFSLFDTKDYGTVSVDYFEKRQEKTEK